MKSEEQILHGTFINKGGSITKELLGLFTNSSDTSTDMHTIGTKLSANTGTLIERTDNTDMPMSHVRISFIKDDTTDKCQNTYTSVKTVYDYCITDEHGNYTVFLEPGTYTIRIDGGKFSRTLPNQIIEDGLINQYYDTLTHCNIMKRLENTIYFYGSDKRIVYGKLVDEYNEPINDATIIVSQGSEIITFFKTKEDGKYFFCLDNGVYDIRLRSKKQSIQIIKNYKFDDTVGFLHGSDNQ